jgi:putative membrane protein
VGSTEREGVMSEQEDISGRKAPLRAGIAFGVFVLIVAAIYLADPDNLDLWMKAFHVMAVISWMAGLFYLPRLFIYHHQTKVGSESSELFKVMESRLYRAIMNPAMMIAWVLGLHLAWSSFAFHGGWLHIKLLMVVLLTGVHIHYGRALRAFARDERPRSQRYWRIMNEVPVFLMIVIVLMVVLKPF